MARLTMLRPRVGTLRTGVAAPPLEVDRMSSRPWARLRAQVLSANPLCVHCQREGRVEAATEVDHVVPLWEGGSDALGNLAATCGPCHALKTADEARRRQAGRRAP
jgi:5-methylcytosine-specific restriction protein A